MTFEQIWDTIKSLAKSSGRYERLYFSLLDLQTLDPDEFEKFKIEMENKKFKDEVDLILFLED